MHDEGPFYQTQRFDRYRDVIDELLGEGTPIAATAPRRSSTQMRAAADRAQGEAALRRPLPRAHASARPGVAPVVRFKNPLDGRGRRR